MGVLTNRIRYLQLIMLYLVILCSGIVRNCMSVGVLTMIEKSEYDIKVYDWNKEIQGVILSSFMWGELVTQAVGGVISTKIGYKLSITISTVTSGLMLALMPFSAWVGGWMGVCVCRVLQGAVQSVIFPCIHGLIGKWAPLSERTRSGVYVYTGIYASIIIASPFAAYVAKSSLGWPWIFYIYGMICITYGILYLKFGSNSPAEHKSISISERRLIEGSSAEEPTISNKKIPWKSIITSKPFFALMMTHVCCDWGYTVITTEMATYFKTALRMDLKTVGLLTSLANVGAIIAMICLSTLSDKSINNGWLSVTNGRKLFNSLGSFGAAGSLAILIMLPKESSCLAVVFMMTPVIMDTAISSGYFLNHIDLSPNFAGVLCAITSNVSKITCIMAPLLTGFLVKDPNDPVQWRIVLMMTASAYFVGNMSFVMFGTGVKQEWDAPKKNINEETEMEGTTKPFIDK